MSVMFMVYDLGSVFLGSSKEACGVLEDWEWRFSFGKSDDTIDLCVSSVFI